MERVVSEADDVVQRLIPADAHLNSANACFPGIAHELCSLQ
jgi:hypothetical protein